MHLTRREFATTTASGLSLFALEAKAEAPRVDQIRYAHLELPAGPYSREALARIVARAGELIGLSTPESATAIGATIHDVTFPAEFALTLVWPGGSRVMVRASRMHATAPELTVRSDRETIEFRLDGDRWTRL